MWNRIKLLRLTQKIVDIKAQKDYYTNYVFFIDLKNMFVIKLIIYWLFNKLFKLSINKEKIGTIKLLYSKTKLKVSNRSEYINVKNFVLQRGLISPMLFDLYINDLINELDKYSF